MSMLAEPRRRKHYTLTPRGKPLYEDESRFGTKMLEKMGWSKDKGLGANEDGVKDFVRVKYKNCSSGFGFEARDDQWTQHEEHFSGLLQTLNNEVDSRSSGEGAEADAKSDEEPKTNGFGFAVAPVKREKLKEKFSGESLEEKSKQSRARVHYKKFTRGKDLSLYSEKDLANIFGKKVVEERQENGLYEQFTALKVAPENEAVESKNTENEGKKAEETGVLMVSSTMTTSEYFKMKMEALKSKAKESVNDNKEEDKGEEAAVSKKAKKRRRAEEEEQKLDEELIKVAKKKKPSLETPEDDTISDDSSSKDLSRKRKKKSPKSSGEDVPQVPEVMPADLPKKKKKNEKPSEVSVEVVADVPAKAEKKKKRKKDSTESSENKEKLPGDAAADEVEAVTPKKNKKSKKKSLDKDDTVTEKVKKGASKKDVQQSKKSSESSEEVREEKDSTVKDNPKKKKKKSEETQEVISSIKEPAETTENLAEKNDKKRKKKSSEKTDPEVREESADDPLAPEALSEAQTNSKKRKKNSSKSSEASRNEDTLVAEPTSEEVPVKAPKKGTKQNKWSSEGSEEVKNSGTQEVIPEPAETTENTVARSERNEEEEATPATLTLDELKAQMLKYNVYSLCTSSAERFRNVDFDSFSGSNLSEVVGYSFSEDIKVELSHSAKDEERIIALWDCTVAKYKELTLRQKYADYLRKAKDACKSNIKRPRFLVKSLKRKDCFQGI